MIVFVNSFDKIRKNKNHKTFFQAKNRKAIFDFQ